LTPRRGENVGAVDAYLLANLVLSLIFLALSSPIGVSWFEWIFIGYGAIRVLEIMVYHVNTIVLERNPLVVRSYRRIVVLALQGYVEVLFWFALFYRNGSEWFRESRIISTFDGFLYMSIVTMATIGYGDITPITRGGRLIVIAQIGCAVFLTLVILARLVTLIPTPKTLDPNEKD
jgi:hypothetical protein